MDDAGGIAGGGPRHGGSEEARTETPDRGAAQGLSEARGLPADVQQVIVDHSDCEHWAGEEPYDAARRREIHRGIAASCKGLDSSAVLCANATPNIPKDRRAASQLGNGRVMIRRIDDSISVAPQITPEDKAGDRGRGIHRDRQQPARRRGRRPARGRGDPRGGRGCGAQLYRDPDHPCRLSPAIRSTRWSRRSRQRTDRCLLIAPFGHAVLQSLGTRAGEDGRQSRPVDVQGGGDGI